MNAIEGNMIQAMARPEVPGKKKCTQQGSNREPSGRRSGTRPTELVSMRILDNKYSLYILSNYGHTYHPRYAHSGSAASSAMGGSSEAVLSYARILWAILLCTYHYG